MENKKYGSISIEEKKNIDKIINSEKIDTEDMIIYANDKRLKLIDKHGFCIRVIDISYRYSFKLMYEDFKRFSNEEIIILSKNIMYSKTKKIEAITDVQAYNFNEIRGASHSIEYTRDKIKEEDKDKVKKYDSERISYCIMSNDLIKLKEILKKDKSFVNGNERFRKIVDSPLMDSAYHGLSNILIELLKYEELDINYQNKTFEETALMKLVDSIDFSARNGKVPNIKMLKKFLAFKHDEIRNLRNYKHITVFELVEDERIKKELKQSYELPKDFTPKIETNREELENTLEYFRQDCIKINRIRRIKALYNSPRALKELDNALTKIENKYL